MIQSQITRTVGGQPAKFPRPAALMAAPETHRGRHPQADRDHAPANPGAGHPAHERGPPVPARNLSGGHEGRHPPIDRSAPGEPDRRDPVDAGCETGAYGHAPVQVAQAEQAEGGEHHDADAGSEVAAVDRDQKLARDRAERRARWRLVGRAGLRLDPPPGHPGEELLQREDRGREEDQRGDEAHEQLLGRGQEQDCTQRPSRERRQQERVQPRARSVKVTPEREHRRERPREDRNRVGAVGDDRRQPRPDQHREGQERASPGERIHAAPGERGTEERRETARRHKRHPAPSSRPESPEPAYAAGVAAARGLSARVPTPAT